MKQWTKDIEINAPLEGVWEFFNGSEENIKKIMPQVVEHKPINITDGMVGSVYRQKYKEGNRIEEYEIKTLEYTNSPTKKKLKVSFRLANMFDITAQYELEKTDDKRTRFRYTVTNQPLKWFIKIFLLFASDKVVNEFVKRVKKVAEAELNSN